ncbi:MAG TPA: acetyl-CoA acetyltransferase [Gammaproteobacteria bacterium]|nr:acetyl-CoA acetyltransferase [Gammaproteobacteria bacterium]MDP6733292.1 acetyl-CoA acetyltransferase [Gammaproteobacteria bacterium]HAJ75698.1 acetyl-CoA acetyltransferase [Gammaproteobacteria bacterium]
MEDSTPILVGAGQFTEKEVPPEEAHPPMGIAALAAGAALADSGIGSELAAHIDTVFAIRIFPDSTNRPRLQIPFGRAENPPRAIARRIGADPVNAVYGNVGGNTPQKYINEIAERISEGDIAVALIAGSEAIKTAQRALRADIMLDWQEHDPGSQEDRGLGEKLMTPHEFAHGIGIPIQTYPLFENALRAKQGNSLDQHMLQMGQLFQNFSEVAADNPYSYYGVRRNARELTTVSPENRLICYPYPKWMNAMDSVNQGAAVIMTSVAKARELGIAQSKWVFLHGCGEANEKLMVSERVNYSSAPALELNAQKALAMAGKSVDDMAYFDCYSCFPSAVEIACDELGLSYDDPRGFTVTGGLPFFGGPGNNYTLHGVASMLPLLRANATRYGLVTANGGYLSKHATGVYSAIPLQGKWQREKPSSYQAEIDSMESPPFTETPQGNATIETYTVCFNRGVPEKGIIVGRLANNDNRFVANTPADPALLQSMTESEQIGRPGTVLSMDGMNTFTPL